MTVLVLTLSPRPQLAVGAVTLTTEAVIGMTMLVVSSAAVSLIVFVVTGSPSRIVSSEAVTLTVFVATGSPRRIVCVDADVFIISGYEL